MPSEHVEDFKSVRKFKIFNTNNLWVNLKGKLPAPSVVTPAHNFDSDQARHGERGHGARDHHQPEGERRWSAGHPARDRRWCRDQALQERPWYQRSAVALLACEELLGLVADQVGHLLARARPAGHQRAAHVRDDAGHQAWGPLQEGEEGIVSEGESTADGNRTDPTIPEALQEDPQDPRARPLDGDRRRLLRPQRYFARDGHQCVPSYSSRQF